MVVKTVEKFKDIELSERKWRIKKFDARTGSYVMYKVAGFIAPIFKGSKLSDITNTEGAEASEGSEATEKFNIMEIIESLSSLSEKDFNYLQDKCLGVCSENLPSGFTNVLSNNSQFAVVGLEDDTSTVMMLTVHALMFNVKSFFQGTPLQNVVDEKLDMLKQTM